jgi:non-heme chloroperoxidase
MEAANFTARDGLELAYQYFGCDNARATVIFLHGSTYNSRRYANVAKSLEKQQFNVVLADWRGHGASAGKPGDTDYIGQLEDDLADLISHCQTLNDLPLVIAGHSAGAVICLRYIVKYGCDAISAVSLVAPAINGPSEAVRYQQPSAGWQYHLSHFRKAQPTPQMTEQDQTKAQKFAPTLNSFRFWSAKFLPALRHKPVLIFPANQQMAKLEGRVLEYSFNLMMSCDISLYPEAFNQIIVPVLLLAGERDEVIHPDFLETVFNWHLPTAVEKQLILIPRLNHMNIVQAAGRAMPGWLDSVFPPVEKEAVA